LKGTLIRIERQGARDKRQGKKESTFPEVRDTAIARIEKFKQLA